VCPYASGARLAKRGGERSIVVQLSKRLRQRIRIVGVDEQAASGLLEDFRKGTATCCTTGTPVAIASRRKIPLGSA